MAWDLDEKHRVCYSLGYFWEVFDFEITTEWHINECYFGALGYVANAASLLDGADYKDCSKRRYTPI